MIATPNRKKLAPRLPADGAITPLWRNVIAKIVLGLLALTVAGLLVGSPPPLHAHGAMPHHVHQ
jgi:hypothetical protein